MPDEPELPEAVDLVAFLTARWDEEYEETWGAAPSPWTAGPWSGDYEGPRVVLDKGGNVTAVAYYGGTYGHILRQDPSKVLADIKAKREVLAALSDFKDGLIWGWAESSRAEDALRALAQPYADHPDFDPDWKV